MNNWWLLLNDSQIIVWRPFDDFPMTDEIFLAVVENLPMNSISGNVLYGFPTSIFSRHTKITWSTT